MVLNKKTHGIPANAIYIGRPSIWGNQFTHLNESQAKFKVATREEAVQAYAKWLGKSEQKEFRASVRQHLKGKDLVCWCAPLRCHGDVLQQVANTVSDAELWILYKQGLVDVNPES